MDLRRNFYPPNYWSRLHHGLVDKSPHEPRKPRRFKRTTIDICLNSLSPHIQKFIYNGAIDKRKGEIRACKLPLSPAQFSMIKALGGSKKYAPVLHLLHSLDLQCEFRHKGYERAVQNIEFRLQTQKPVIPGRASILLLRIRVQQKPPILAE